MSTPKDWQKDYPSDQVATEESLDDNSSLKKMLKLIDSGKEVIDFGCATGYFSRLLQNKGCIVTGVEINPDAAKIAEQYCEKVIVADLDYVSIKDIFPEQRFDVAVFGDVLEHLRNPWRVLEETKHILKEDGYVVASIPNIAHGSIRLSLLQGRFEYTEFGILDNTHIRFFTRETVKELFKRAGYLADIVDRTKLECFAENNLIPKNNKHEFSVDTIKKIEDDSDSETLQFVVRSYPHVQYQLHCIQSELERSQSQLQHTQSELGRSQSQLQHTQSELERSQSQLQHTQSELERSQNNILAMESSKFWKLRQLWFKAKKILLIDIDTDFTKIKKSKLLLKSFLKKVLYRLTAFGSKFLPSKKKGIILKTESSIPIKYSTKKKMMLIWPFIAVGGAEGIVLNIVENEIINNEFDFIHVCLYEQSTQLGDLSESFERSSLAFYKAKNFQDPNTILDRINYLIKFHEIEVLFIPSGTSFFYNSLKRIRSKFPNLRIVNQVYDHNEGWIQSYSMLNVSLIDCHIAPNLLIKNKYIEYGVSDDKSPLVYHGINLDDFNYAEYSHVNIEDLKKMFNIPLDKVIVTFAARMHSQKRPLDFLEIAKRFSSDDRFHFLMVGDGDLSNEVEKKIQFYNLSNITKLGFQRPIQNIYLCTDILVITSQYEGLPLVLLEGLSMGIPAISTSVGAISEVIDNENTGILIKKVGDVDSFCNALDYMARNLNFIQNKCRESRYNLTKEFSVETMCKKYLNAFNG